MIGNGFVQLLGLLLVVGDWSVVSSDTETDNGVFDFPLFPAEAEIPSPDVVSELKLITENVIVPQSRMETCAPVFSCNFNSKFRTIDGKCNNVANPLWGSSEIPFIRYIASDYEDGVGVTRGENRQFPYPLPTPRRVSVAMSNTSAPFSSSEASLMVMQWGQFLDHDLVFTPEHEGPCCDDGLNLSTSSPDCRPIDVTNDNFYSQFGVNCLTFHRSLETTCQQGPREQINSVTSYLDASNVYGSTPQEEQSLRGLNGQLIIGQGSEDLSSNSNPHCPLTHTYTFLPSTINAEGEEQFLAGDRRSQEQPGLTSIHTLFVRAHNHMASQFFQKYPDAGSDAIYQETRRIIGALMQHITYNEFLPVVLGSAFVSGTGLAVPTNGYTYNPNVIATAPNNFATATFRFGHSLISDNYFLRDATVQLSHSFRNHGVTMNLNTYPSDFLEGIAFAPAETMDQIMVPTLTNFLFAEGPSFSHGSDLLARNILRGRDHGISSYNNWRYFCGLPTFDTFSQLQDVMPTDVALQFFDTYGSVDDIDLFPALIAERPVGDSLVGPTLQCLIGNHFASLKYGDRYWYETTAQPQRFTDDQLAAIRRTTLASLICAYTETPEMQPLAMRIISNGNSLRNCVNNILPGTIPVELLNLF